MKDKVNKPRGLAHISFEIGLIIKSIHALIEIIGGLSMLYISPVRLNWLIIYLTQNEISHDPDDLVANFLINISSSFSISSQRFAVFYLLSHGIIAAILIALLWRKKLWAYPLVIITLILFIAYQIYRYTLTQSVFLVLLTICDAVMIYLSYLEYKGIKADLNAK